jgi:hypothetical protein
MERNSDTITPTIWNNSVEHVNIIIKTWWERELICDRNEIAPLIINIGEDSISKPIIRRLVVIEHSHLHLIC